MCTFLVADCFRISYSNQNETTIIKLFYKKQERKDKKRGASLRRKNVTIQYIFNFFFSRTLINPWSIFSLVMLILYRKLFAQKMLLMLCYMFPIQERNKSHKRWKIQDITHDKNGKVLCGPRLKFGMVDFIRQKCRTPPSSLAILVPTNIFFFPEPSQEHSPPFFTSSYSASTREQEEIRLICSKDCKCSCYLYGPQKGEDLPVLFSPIS